MNQSKFSLADVIGVLAALAFGFVSFMGANFLNIDNEKVWGMPHTTGCIIIGFVCALLLFSSAFGAKHLKSTDRNFKTCFVLEVILLILFVIFAIFFASNSAPFPHYFKVNEQESEINSKLKTSITQAENMFIEYETYAKNREYNYKNKLQSVANACMINQRQCAAFGFDVVSNIPYSEQIDTKMFTVHAHLFPSNYSDTVTHNGIKDVATKWLQEAKINTSSWKPIGIVGVVNEIEKNSNDWLNTLVQLSQVPEKFEQVESFSYKLSFGEVRNYFKLVSSPPVFAIIFAVLAYMLIILSWFVAKRSTRFPGLKILFGLSKSNGNQL